MEFKFDSRQPFQQEAIASVVDLFEGQPADADALEAKLQGILSVSDGQQSFDMAAEVGAVGNNLLLDEEALLQNLQAVQDRNGLEVAAELSSNELDFDIEMETGTGKTYVYLRTIFELAQKYNFRKFVILVPSTPIKEGVTTSIKLMAKHFQELYAEPFDATVYSGNTAEEVQSFATSTSVQIMVMSIHALRGDKNSRIIHQVRDRLSGLRPIDYLKATRPVVIMDEPQNMESLLSQSAVMELYPLCTLRYSATHRKTRNVVFRLDPVDAHDLGLVKQIVVAEALQQGADATPYVKLVSVRNDTSFVARMELAVRKKSDGSIERKTLSVKNGQELAVVTRNSAYDGWRLNELSIEPESVELFPHGWLQAGEAIGGSNDSVYREMIRETIREHLRKETMLRSHGIKVLSLFFVDKVASFLGEGYDNVTANGDFVKWFDELLREERAKSPKWAALLPGDPVNYRRAYFSILKGRKGQKDTFKDTSGVTAGDDDAYELIMRNKAQLLDEAEPVRFVFSHSALREGWDNPNIFQICALREMGESAERRQTIGRGLRLPVNQTGERVADRGIAQLTVVANESYREFADSLQKEYRDSGVSIGLVRVGEFAKIPTLDEELGEERRLGFTGSKLIWNELVERSFLDKEGKVTANFRPETLGFGLGPAPDFFWPQNQIIQVMLNCRIERLVKTQRKRVARKLNKEIYSSPWFEEFWRIISQRTTYRVSLDREQVIDNAVNKIKAEQPILPLRVQVTRAGLKIVRGGTRTDETATRSANLTGAYQLPDIISELQGATSLTRTTLVDVLIRSGKLGEFIGNPNDFIAMVKRNLLNVVAASVQDGIQYEKVGGYVYELRELQADGAEARDLFIDRAYKTSSFDDGKTDFDYIQIDSDGAAAPERLFAEKLDSREDVKFFMKLPEKFKIETPVGPYNPDWAIIKQDADGSDRIYMIRETKSTLDDSKRRPTENAKINAATEHFKQLGIGSETIPAFAVSVPGNWNL
ncbi:MULTISPECIES: restriction endonuclease [unclassified Rhodococcus (in: high G+C Gram-positive bacteria)]|uniref:restriction endonuclease n=1 Tax=unclassified Rhodococcus (in: high G+C Gram-positive bacteria) TaxID=192944 RepID=UPI0007BB8789|nr:MULTISPECIES: DEAD/DEAH box helicase family protein [unclassified Rhodococcus (in: high G+C Gram-positive bacteria)]KZF09495.1 restriction endonuclease [Rhodococcus sp. EPR-147]KZF11754.1 restriction endonuclease [Rhodococcus sp. EPR-279]